MKVLQICPWLGESPLNTTSGVSNAAYHISNELAKRGHEITLCASALNAPGDRNDKVLITNKNLKVARFPYVLHHGTFFLTLGFLPYLRNNVADFDIIHIHDFRHFQAIAAHHYATKYRIPYVLQAHGAALQLGKTGVKFLFDMVWGERIIKDADLLLALTAQERDQYRSLGSKEHETRTLANGVDISEFIDLPVRGEFRRKHGIRQNKQVILFLSRINRVKGLDLLLDAFNLLQQDLDDAILVVVGPDDDGSAIVLQRQVHESGLSDKVRFIGPLYQRDKLEAYVDADVYVLPSRYETFPLTVLEAWACGTPLIVTDRCGISEYVKKAGRVVEFDSVELYKALLSVLVDKTWRAHTSKIGQELVRAEFSWDRIIDQLEAFYFELSENKHRDSVKN